jgi:hypothetical protein
MRLLIFVILLLPLCLFGQSKNKNQGRRFGIGAQVIEPTGINFQTFRGFFNDNNTSFATYGVLELGVGIENMLSHAGEKVYGSGTWSKGGWRVDLNYLYPLLTLQHPFVFQVYAGTGIQTGSRNYTVSGAEESTFATGGNLMLRVELVTHGIDMGRSVWFFSIYSDLKYHFDFTESFDYVSPVVGIRMRKGR